MGIVIMTISEATTLNRNLLHQGGTGQGWGHWSSREQGGAWERAWVWSGFLEREARWTAAVYQSLNIADMKAARSLLLCHIYYSGQYKWSLLL